MGALINLTGQQFGHLTVTRRLADAITPSGARQPTWACECWCGRETAEEGRALRAGRATSCRECVRDPARMLKYAATYVAYWPELYVLKVGRAWRESRIEHLRQSGAEILLYMRGTDDTWEREALAELATTYPRAFDTPAEAVDVLDRGRGWSECFLVDHHEVRHAFDLCMTGFLRGNDLGYNPPATAEWRRALAEAQRARRVAPGRSADADGDHDAGGLERPDAAEPRAARDDAVPGGAVAASCEPDRDAHPRARGCALPADGDRLGRGRVGGRHDGADTAIFTGCGRECASGCGRAGACERASARAASSTPATLATRCSAPRLPRPSQRRALGLWSLPHRPHAPRAVDGQSSLRSRPRSVSRRRLTAPTADGPRPWTDRPAPVRSAPVRRGLTR